MTSFLLSLKGIATCVGESAGMVRFYRFGLQFCAICSFAAVVWVSATRGVCPLCPSDISPAKRGKPAHSLRLCAPLSFYERGLGGTFFAS